MGRGLRSAAEASRLAWHLHAKLNDFHAEERWGQGWIYTSEKGFTSAMTLGVYDFAFQFLYV